MKKTPSETDKAFQNFEAAADFIAMLESMSKPELEAFSDSVVMHFYRIYIETERKQPVIKTTFFQKLSKLWKIKIG